MLIISNNFTVTRARYRQNWIFAVCISDRHLIYFGLWQAIALVFYTESRSQSQVLETAIISSQGLTRVQNLPMSKLCHHIWILKPSEVGISTTFWFDLVVFNEMRFQWSSKQQIQYKKAKINWEIVKFFPSNILIQSQINLRFMIYSPVNVPIYKSKAAVKFGCGFITPLMTSCNQFNFWMQL